MTNADFDFEETFPKTEHEVTVSGIKVDYKSTSVENTIKKEILAKFTYQSLDYYLEIVTEGEVEAKIEQFVNLLID